MDLTVVLVIAFSISTFGCLYLLSKNKIESERHHSWMRVWREIADGILYYQQTECLKRIIELDCESISFVSDRLEALKLKNLNLTDIKTRWEELNDKQSPLSFYKKRSSRVDYFDCLTIMHELDVRSVTDLYIDLVELAAMRNGLRWMRQKPSSPLSETAILTNYVEEIKKSQERLEFFVDRIDQDLVNAAIAAFNRYETKDGISKRKSDGSYADDEYIITPALKRFSVITALYVRVLKTDEICLLEILGFELEKMLVMAIRCDNNCHKLENWIVGVGTKNQFFSEAFQSSGWLGKPENIRARIGKLVN